MLYRSDLTLIKLVKIIENEVEDVQIVSKDLLAVDSLGCKLLCAFGNDNLFSATSVFLETTPLKILNEWNAKRTIGRAYLSHDDYTTLQSDLYIGEGITEEQIQGFIKLVAFTTMIFKTKMGEYH
ncbi:YbjN domain-containing protein [Mannheimia pernigra]|uniref:YbjN domain-containing protein n=1 Tax=Mannheimia pernigra TaxID=111844 RepID=UPI001317920F|nr:YbjN domain-containing protein [Mannheimia pernigra]QHB16681.1 hypothetical protein GM695_00660 [Mannheimia pernigra]